MPDPQKMDSSSSALFELEAKYGVPVELCAFQFGSRRYSSTHDVLKNVPATALAAVKVLPLGLKGGKGGFGANLKSAGRQKSQASFDFSACRDLNGRRLRAVNDAQRIAAWKSPAEVAKRARLGAHYQEPSGDLGVSGWHLAVPNWADSFGPKTVKRLQAAASRKEQRLIQAQEEAAAAAEAAKEQRLRKIEEYANSASGVVPQAVMLDAIRTGMSRREKRPRSPPSDGGAGGVEFPPPDVTTVPMLPDSAAHWCRVLGPSSQVSLQYLAAEHDAPAPAAVAAAAAASGAAGDGKSAGDVTTPAIVEVEALVPFVTVGVPGAAVSSGAWHFEVTVASGGVTQIGWMAPSALDADDSDGDEADSAPVGAAAAAAAAAGGDGVGDVAQSWAWDGSRGTVFAAGTERSGAHTWSAGDTVGCSLQWSADGTGGDIQWRVNGKAVEKVPFQRPSGGAAMPLMPALSLQQGEAVQLNVGHSGFAFDAAPEALPVARCLAGSASGAPASPLAVAQPTATAGAAQASASSTAAAAAAGGGSGSAAVPVTSSSQLELRSMTQEQVKEACSALPLEQLKIECLLRGLKCSGTAQQRTARLAAAATHLASGGETPVPRKMRAVDFDALFGQDNP